jgi:heme-degrading monooxygenase HmoA
MSERFAKTPEPPYYAVIFSACRSGEDRGYAKMADRMVELARTMPGFLGVETTRDGEGFGITVSYWESEEAIAGWRENSEHLKAQQFGREVWYDEMWLRIAKVERARKISRDALG